QPGHGVHALQRREARLHWTRVPRGPRLPTSPPGRTGPPLGPRPGPLPAPLGPVPGPVVVPARPTRPQPPARDHGPQDPPRHHRRPRPMTDTPAAPTPAPAADGTSPRPRRNARFDPLTPEQRSLRARLASHASWARTDDPSARTAPARSAFFHRFEQQVDP